MDSYVMSVMNIPAIKCYKKYFKIIDFIYTKPSVSGIQFILYRNIKIR